MKILMVSHNCGAFYHEKARAETADALADHIENAETQGLRWYIADEQGNIDFEHLSSIHRGIISWMDAVSRRGGS